MARYLVGAVLTVALVVGAGAARVPDPLPSPEQILREAGPTPWKGAGVIHVRWHGLTEEEWLDRATGATRRIEYEDLGERYLRVQDGKRIYEWPAARPGARLTVLVDPHDPRLETASRLLTYWHKLHRGHARVIGRGHVGGRRVWILEDLEKPSPKAPPGTRAFADVDHEWLLVLRERLVLPSGIFAVTAELEELPRAAVPAAFFAPDRRWTSLERRLRYGDLGSVPFRVFAPGRRYGRLSFTHAALFDQRGPIPARVRETLPELWIGYARGGRYDEPVLQLMQFRRPNGWSRERGDERIRIAGKMRLTHVGKEGGLFSAVVGETVIDGRSQLTRSEVVRVLEALRPVRH